MSDCHAETYIVHVNRKAGVTSVEIQRNDGDWYDEDFTVVKRTAEVAEVGAVIASDFETRAGGADTDPG